VFRAGWAGSRTAVRRHGWLLLTLASVVGIGTFFRFYQLGDIPSDPTSDHAEKLLDVHDLETGERRPVFFTRNTGREPAQFYVTYALMKGLGLSLSFETLKIGTALVGVLAIPAVFLFASEVAGRITGLFAATLFAIATWPIGWHVRDSGSDTRPSPLHLRCGFCSGTCGVGTGETPWPAE
jgi:hypothetical protein